MPAHPHSLFHCAMAMSQPATCVVSKKGSPREIGMSPSQLELLSTESSAGTLSIFFHTVLGSIPWTWQSIVVLCRRPQYHSWNPSFRKIFLNFNLFFSNWYMYITHSSYTHATPSLIFLSALCFLPPSPHLTIVSFCFCFFSSSWPTGVSQGYSPRLGCGAIPATQWLHH